MGAALRLLVTQSGHSALCIASCSADPPPASFPVEKCGNEKQNESGPFKLRRYGAVHVADHQNGTQSRKERRPDHAVSPPIEPKRDDRDRDSNIHRDGPRAGRISMATPMTASKAVP